MKETGGVSFKAKRTDGFIDELYSTNVEYIPQSTTGISSGQVWKMKGVVPDEINGKYAYRKNMLEVCATNYYGNRKMK